jgi:DNA polymerase I-like protein with 3'-5' exonuclease and polymerase domains
MIAEIVDKQDMHLNNQNAFGLPSRLIAKIFIFRLLFGGSAYSYATDPAFAEVGFNQNQWQEVIDAFYKKYYGIAAWHKRIIEEAQTTCKIVSPINGRYFPFKPEKSYKGELKWPITQIKNYLVQSSGADLVMLARLQTRKLLRESGLDAKMVATVHDSLVASCREADVEQVGKILLESVETLPKMVKQVWGYDMSVPMTAEVQYGKSKGDMKDLKIS